MRRVFESLILCVLLVASSIGFVGGAGKHDDDTPPGITRGSARTIFPSSDFAGTILRNGRQSLLAVTGSGHYGVYTPSNVMRSYRTTYRATFAGGNLRFYFPSYGSQNTGVSLGEAPSFPYWLKATVQRVGAYGFLDQTGDRTPMTFGGKRWIKVIYQGDPVSDPVPFQVGSGEYFHAYFCLQGGLLNAPSAPTLTPSGSGGTIAAGTYRVVVTYQYRSPSDGGPDETKGSTETSTGALTGSTSSVAVTSPSAPTGANVGATGWNVYITRSNAAGPYYLVKQNVPVGTDFTITAIPSTSPNQPPQGWPLGRELDRYGVNNLGEGYAGDVDYTDAGTTAYVAAGVYTPTAITAEPTGVWPQSGTILGDSIHQGGNDVTLPTRMGGYWAQALNLGSIPYVMPAYPGMTLAQDGVDAAWVCRWKTTSLATTALDNLGTNDLSATPTISVSTQAAMETRMLKRALQCISGGQFYVRETLWPRCTSTDGFVTIGNEAITGAGTYEPIRTGLNSWMRLGTSTGSAVSAVAPTTGTINGTNKAFEWATSFVVGSETVVADGVTKTAGTDYSYTIRAGGFASGITLGTAPSTTLTMAYRARPGFVACVGGGGKATVFDGCALFEVNSSNVLTTNGGYWKAQGALSGSGTWTSNAAANGTLNNVVLTDTGQTWTVDALRGATIKSNHSGTLSYFAVISNTATALTCQYSTGGPVIGDTFQWFTGTVTSDGIHLTNAANATVGTWLSTRLNTYMRSQPGASFQPLGLEYAYVDLASLRRSRFDDLLKQHSAVLR